MSAKTMTTQDKTTVRFKETPGEADQFDTDTDILETLNAVSGSPYPEVRFDPDHWDVDGTLNTALELIFSAPAFDGVDAHELEAALGDGVHAVIIDPSNDTEIVATNPSFDARSEITRENCPVCVDDTIPIEDNPATFVDWPTGGPQFRIGIDAGETMLSQVSSTDVFDQ